MEGMVPKFLDSTETDLYHRAMEAAMRSHQVSPPDWNERISLVMRVLSSELEHRALDLRSTNIMLARSGSPEELRASGWDLCSCRGSGCAACDGEGIKMTQQ
jgi:hypothetical protein